MAYYCWHCYGRNDVDNGLCEHCGGEIGPPPHVSAVQRLIWATRHPDPDVAILATRRIGTEGDVRAVPALRALIDEPPDPYVAAEALRSLVALSGIDAQRQLLQQLADDGPILLRTAARKFLDAGAARAE